MYIFFKIFKGGSLSTAASSHVAPYKIHPSNGAITVKYIPKLINFSAITKFHVVINHCL